MTGDVLSGGVVVVLAAALWLAYLVPTWLRRREYMSTERNAVRLQQTLRILAETAEVPQQVRVEATAREVAVQQRILRKEEERMLVQAEARAVAEANVRRVQAEAEATAAAPARALSEKPVATAALTQTVAAVDDGRRRAMRIRRARAITSLFLLVALVVVGLGVADAVAGGALLLLAGGGLLAVTACVVLARLARNGRVRVVVPATVVPAVEREVFDHADHVEAVPAAPSTWTPRPLPKPLYQRSGTIAASAMASVDAATELRRAAARADVERRAAELAPERSPQVAPLRPVPVPVAAPAAGAVSAAAVSSSTASAGNSRFARMGMLENVESDAIDLDAVLRRRRAVG